jgi:hypothetical protein
MGFVSHPQNSTQSRQLGVSVSGGRGGKCSWQRKWRLNELAVYGEEVERLYHPKSFGKRGVGPSGNLRGTGQSSGRRIAGGGSCSVAGGDGFPRAQRPDHHPPAQAEVARTVFPHLVPSCQPLAVPAEGRPSSRPHFPKACSTPRLGHHSRDTVPPFCFSTTLRSRHLLAGGPQ